MEEKGGDFLSALQLNSLQNMGNDIRPTSTNILRHPYSGIIYLSSLSLVA
jgi:hypothetical protein